MFVQVKKQGWLGGNHSMGTDKAYMCGFSVSPILLDVYAHPKGNSRLFMSSFPRGWKGFMFLSMDRRHCCFTLFISYFLASRSLVVFFPNMCSLNSIDSFPFALWPQPLSVHWRCWLCSEISLIWTSELTLLMLAPQLFFFIFSVLLHLYTTFSSQLIRMDAQGDKFSPEPYRKMLLCSTSHKIRVHQYMKRNSNRASVV